jgi:hypothetical protein
VENPKRREYHRESDIYSDFEEGSGIEAVEIPEPVDPSATSHVTRRILPTQSLFTKAEKGLMSITAMGTR